MFRLTQYMRELATPTPVRTRRGTGGTKPVVIWNLTRRCNLRCRHCYTTSADVPFPGELSHEQAISVLDDLNGYGIPALILSGGEPLSRFDIFDLARYARDLSFRHLALSTNGTKIDREKAAQIADLNFDYVGISIDGMRDFNDWFRGGDDAFVQAMTGLRECKKHGIKVGLRFTITEQNAHMLDDMLALCDSEGVDKFYLSHLVYAGRGDKNRGEDTAHLRARRALDTLIARAWEDVSHNRPLEIVTGNNDTDAVYFLQWVQRHFDTDQAAHVAQHLEAWGGNSSGLGVANIDPTGDVHPDTYWSAYRIGNVKETPFTKLWQGSDRMLATLRQRPRPLKGRCGDCAFQRVCGGNTRIRALQVSGDPWAEDPACYMSNAELGIADSERLTVTPFRGKSHDPAYRFF